MRPPPLSPRSQMIISDVGRTALVANLGSPAALILEMQCWDLGKQIGEGGNTTVIVVDAFVCLCFAVQRK